MKKMLSTTLVAIAFAMVSTADAKVMRRTGATQTTAAQTVRETAQDAVMNPTQANANQVVDMLANDPAGVAIAQKEAKQLEVNNQKKLVASLGKKGWIFDGRTEEEKQAHKNATDKLTQLEQELKDLGTDNDIVKKEVGISYYNAMLGAFVVALAVSGISVIDDIAFGGKGKEMVAPYVKPVYEAGKGAVVGSAAAVKRGYKAYAPRVLGGE